MSTPRGHYAEAERLLAELADVDLTLPFARMKLAKAEVHALLASCGDGHRVGDDVGQRAYDEQDPLGFAQTRSPTGERL